MSIDWFTAVAQAVNFLVLLALLRRYLFVPLLRTVDERERVVRDRLASARREAERAAEETTRVEAERAELEASRSARIEEAREEARALRDRLAEEVRAEMALDRERWHTAVDRERRALVVELRERTVDQVVAVARRVLHDLVDADLEERVATAFVARLHDLPDASWDELRADAGGTGEDESAASVRVRSAFGLAPQLRREIEATVGERLGRPARFEYAVAPELVCGIQLRVRGHKLAWSVADHLGRIHGEAADSARDDGGETDGDPTAAGAATPADGAGHGGAQAPAEREVPRDG